MNNINICKQCNSNHIRKTKHIRWSECFIYKCVQCNNFWYVCELHNQRFASNRLYQMNKHFSAYHTANHYSHHKPNSHKEAKSISNTEQNEINDQVYIDNDCFDCSDEMISDNSSGELSLLGTSAKTISDHEVYACNTNICNIVTDAFSRHNQSESNITQTEALLHIDVCDFMLKLSSTQQWQMLRILNTAKMTELQNTRIPRSLSEIRTFYTDNQQSIIQSMPIPKIFQYDNHVCVKINDVLNHILSNGVDIPVIKSSSFDNLSVDNSSLLNTMVVHDILKDVNFESKKDIDPYVIFISLWSDDFEVNHTRRNKSSTWIKTVTFISPNHSDTSVDHTQAICLACKKSDHDKVNQQFNEELQHLGQPVLRYIPKLKQTVPTVVRLVAYLADRPERNALNGLSSHTATASKRWMYSSLVDPYKLVSCSQCFKDRVSNMFQIHRTSSNKLKRCRKCCDFEYNEFEPSVKNQFELPPHHPNIKDNFPMSRNEEKELSLCSYNKAFKPKTGKGIPIKLSYEILINSMRYAVYQYLKKRWTKKETIVYLKLMCIKESIIIHTLTEAEDTFRKNRNPVTTVLDLSLPPMWVSSLLLDQFVDTPMHQLFEGLVKSSLELLSKYLKFHKKWAKFGKMMNELIDDVASLHVGYCKCEPLTNQDDFKGGGWLAETYLGYSRIMVIMTNYLDMFLTPDTVGINEIKLVIQTLYSLLSHLMTNDTTSIDIISNHVKLFLATIHYYEQCIGFPTDSSDKKVFPIWYNRSNFLSLLNLPYQISQYGPLRLYWEGNRERYIQVVKPILVNKRTTVSYLETKLKKIYKLSTFKNMLSHKIASRQLQTNKQNLDIKIYLNLQKVKEKIKMMESIGGIILRSSSNAICVIVKKGNMYLGYEIQVLLTEKFYKGNLPFFQLMINEKNPMQFLSLDNINHALKDYTMMVPFVPNDKARENNGYAIITKNWKFMNEFQQLMIYSPNSNYLRRMIEDIQ